MGRGGVAGLGGFRGIRGWTKSHNKHWVFHHVELVAYQFWLRKVLGAGR